MSHVQASRDSTTATPADVRLDVWLWATRFFKTRALAKQAIVGGKVEIGGESAKPARSLRIGDRLCIVRGQDRFEVEVRVLLDRRASAANAQRCYHESDQSRASREAAAEQRRLAIAGYARPQTKPDKRARRLIIALGDIDSM